MEEELISEGYCVIDSDSEYPEYLQNNEQLYNFWKNVEEKHDAQMSVWSISQYGTPYLCLLKYSDGKGCCIHVSSEWDCKGALHPIESVKKEILYCDNILYYPELIPEVTKVTKNKEGTVTLHVNVICPDKHTDNLFEHDVTLNIESDGNFKYYSNKIVYTSENELPSPQARIEVQRFNTEDTANSVLTSGT